VVRYVVLALKVSRDLEVRRSFKQSSCEGSIVAARCSWLAIVFSAFSVHYCKVSHLHSYKGFAISAVTFRYPSLYQWCLIRLFMNLGFMVESFNGN
jgi:hypothetical protein